MMKANLVSVILLMEMMVISGFRIGSDGVSMDYYLMSCPFVEPVVKDIVNRALEDDPTLAAALIRMHFHDCFIQVPSHSLSLSPFLSLTHFVRVYVMIMFLRLFSKPIL